MSNVFSKFILSTYRRLGSVAYPFMGPFLYIRASKGKEDRNRRYERYGYPSAERPKGPIIWFHAASVGESLAVLPLIEHVHKLGINTIMTTGTVTSAKVVRQRLPDEAYHQYVPLDLKPALERFLDHWKPNLAIFTESEIWPMTIMELCNRNIPRLLVNARMSDRSFKRWKNSSGLAQSLFSNFSHVIAQSELDGERFRQLGASPVTISGNLKVDTNSLPYESDEIKKLANIISDRPCWVAVSTHEGEEEAIGRVHAVVKKRVPNLLTLIVPRHPDRAPGITAMLRQNGLKTVMRSKSERIKPDTDIYMCDTIGEMGLFLNLAQVAFMGKSLIATGGQNPLEPAVTRTAIISGKNVHNFRETYRNLIKNQAARIVADEQMLAANVEYLLRSPAEREKMTDGAIKTVEEMSGALNNTIHTLDAYLFPLTIKRDLESLG